MPEVIEALFDPAFYQGLSLPDIAPPDVLDHNETDGIARLRVRYEYLGTLDPLARTVLGTDRISWVQELELASETGHGNLTIVPGVQAGRVSCSATVVVEPTPTGARRIISGALKINIPLVGGRAERAIAPGILRRLDLEAEALAAFLSGGADTN